MPSMATSHGGLLYYVVQVPKEEHWTATHGYLEEKHSVVTSTPNKREDSTDSGWDNPFRPDGDLSREADEIVELIKGGKPITPTPGAAPPLPAEPAASATTAPAAAATASPRGANGTAASKPASPGAVELQRATVSPGDASQVEHVVLKKKPKCRCCVIQ